MRGSRDPMERLAAADPLAGDERLTPEEEREAEALLARVLATPVTPNTVDDGGDRRGRPRRWAALAAGVAAVAAAAFVAVNLVESDAPGPGVVERAVAAVTREDVVYHVVERTRGIGVADKGGDLTLFLESWHTTDGRMHQKTFASRAGRRGRLLSEFAGRLRRGRRGGPGLMWSSTQNRITEMGFGLGKTPVPHLSPFGDAGAQLRALEEEGRLHPAGTTRVGGRRAYRLASGPVKRPGAPRTEERLVFLVDSETYLPLARHNSIDAGAGRTMRISTRYLVYERLPLTDRTRGLLALDPHPDAKCSRFADRLRGEGELGYPNPCARP
jgi:hypothetical protein